MVCALSPWNDEPPSSIPAVPASEELLGGSAQEGVPVLKAKAFNLSDVRLIADEDNHFAQAQELNTQFLRYLEADRLLYTFRTIAELPQKEGATPYGGWIAPVGHGTSPPARRRL